MRSGQPFEEWRREAIHKLEGRWLGRTQGELWDELPPAEKAKRQSAQILRREKQEAKRQQEALANLERAAQKERRQEAKARAQEEALAQRLVERSQKEREEEARRLEEISNESAVSPESREKTQLELHEGQLIKSNSLTNSYIKRHLFKEIETSVPSGPQHPKGKLEATERHLRQYTVEHAVCLDSRNNILLELVGNENKVHYNASKNIRYRTVTITHNHPDNGPLSVGDFQQLIRWKLHEIRAVVKDGVHSFRLKKKFFYSKKVRISIQAILMAYVIESRQALSQPVESRNKPFENFIERLKPYGNYRFISEVNQ